LQHRPSQTTLPRRASACCLLFALACGESADPLFSSIFRDGYADERCWLIMPERNKNQRSNARDITTR
jgi:hypothetical protein